VERELQMVQPSTTRYRYFVSQSSEFCRHNPSCCLSRTVYCCRRLFRCDSVRKLSDIHPRNFIEIRLVTSEIKHLNGLTHMTSPLCDHFVHRTQEKQHLPGPVYTGTAVPKHIHNLYSHCLKHHAKVEQVPHHDAHKQKTGQSATNRTQRKGAQQT
jgi:hypothetical protein